MIDLHCHILPGLDDGPATMSEALAMASMAAASGTTTVVATPHIDGRWGVRPSELSRRVALLEDALSSEGIPLAVRPGGEIDISRFADLRPEDLDRLRLGGGPCLLLESPLSPAAGDSDMLMLRIRGRGEQILLAHPERCPLFQREPERLVRLVDAGVLCSISTGSLRGQFGEQVRGFTIDLLRAGLVHDLASDAHDDWRRPPPLGDSLSEVEAEIPGISGQADWLTRLAPAAILAGAPLPARPALRAPDPSEPR
jgi:protein-tyrosine phosphatase